MKIFNYKILFILFKNYIFNYFINNLRITSFNKTMKVFINSTI